MYIQVITLALTARFGDFLLIRVYLYYQISVSAMHNYG